MRGFVRSAITWILVFGVVLAIWKLFGGDVGGFFEAVWGFVYLIIEGASNIFIEIFKIFGFTGQ
jgi:hypothetical protein